MLDTAVGVAVNRLNTFIGNVDPEVILGNISLIDAFQDSSSQSLSDKVIASIINIEQEGALRNLPLRRSSVDGNGLPRVTEQQPEIYLNVYILFGANKSDYTIALQRISQVILFFQRQYVFTQDDAPELIPLNIDRLIFDLYSASFDELNQLWSVNGGKYIPSVIYKMRLAMIQGAEETGADIISEINLLAGRVSVNRGGD
jgi:hypothetical protein